MIKLYHTYDELMNDIEQTIKYPKSNYPNAFAEYESINDVCNSIKQNKFAYSVKVKRHDNIYFIKYFVLDNETMYNHYNIFGIKLW